MYEKDKDELKEYLELFNDKVKDNVQIISPDEIGQDFLLHIRTTPTKTLIPNVSKRQGYYEDNSIVRVHTSDHLMGCLIGYAATVSNTMDVEPEKKLTEDTAYLGGYYVYSVPFKAALQPNNQLVYDVKDTDEKWLINYNEENRSFDCNLIGKIIPQNLVATPVMGRLAKVEQTFVLEVVAPEIKLSKKDTIKKGYYRFTLDKDRTEIFDIEEISKKDYDEQKGLKATMLEFKEPPFTKW